jgi:glutathionylspermidine amidase/synthetase
MKYIIILLCGVLLYINNSSYDLDFGSIVGSVNGVDSYSSYKAVKPYQKNYINNIFTGLKWQCVEFARRYLIITKNITFKEINNAYELFDIKHFTSLKDNSMIHIQKCKNGSHIKPYKGSLLIWKQMTDNINGHVAIITQINLDSIMICEQNYKNIKWENNYSRILKFKYNNGYYIEDKNIIGWINILD